VGHRVRLSIILVWHNMILLGGSLTIDNLIDIVKLSSWKCFEVKNFDRSRSFYKWEVQFLLCWSYKAKWGCGVQFFQVPTVWYLSRYSLIASFPSSSFWRLFWVIAVVSSFWKSFHVIFVLYLFPYFTVEYFWYSWFVLYICAI
jgi:hypothetical protein